MSNTDIELSQAERNELHQRVLRTAQARDSSAKEDIDLKELTRIAVSRARAREKVESLEQAEKHAHEALSEAVSDTARMRSYAMKDLQSFEQADAPVRRRGLRNFFIEFTPILLAALIAFLLPYRLNVEDSWESVLMMCVMSGLLWIFYRHRLELLENQLERWHEREYECALLKLNQAVAVAFAGAQAGASLHVTRGALQKVTNVDWIRLEDSESNPGMWETRAESPSAMTALVRVGSDPGASAPELVRCSVPAGGKFPTRFEYLAGTVLKVDLDKVTLELKGGGQREVILPSETFAPPEKSDVIAVLPEQSGNAIFLQQLNGLVTSFLHETRLSCPNPV